MKNIILFGAAILMSAPIAAQSFEEPTRIDEAIANRLGHAVGVAGGAAYRVDPRLRLSRCPTPLLFEIQYDDAVLVQCPAHGWRLRVPAMATSPHAARAVPVVKRGDLISISARGQGFEVVTSATALEDAAIGQAIRVKSSTDGGILRATVTANGQAMIEG